MLLLLLYGLAGLTSVVSLVCAILVIVKMFQRSGPGIGIVGIITCGIGAYIWGWVKSKELALTKLMLVWTAAIVVGIILNVVAGGMAIAAAQNNPEFQKAFRESLENAQRAADDAQKAAEEASKEAPVPAPQ